MHVLYRRTAAKQNFELLAKSTFFRRKKNYIGKLRITSVNIFLRKAVPIYAGEIFSAGVIFSAGETNCAGIKGQPGFLAGSNRAITPLE